LSEAAQDYTRSYNSAHHGGRMRSMIDMIDAVPHARDALQAHLRAHAIGIYYGQPGTVQ